MDRIDRLITGGVENTYMPLVQLYILLPLVIQKATARPPITDGGIDQPLQNVITTADYWTKLIVHGLSIASSLIGLSTTALDLHFRRDSKSF